MSILSSEIMAKTHKKNNDSRLIITSVDSSKAKRLPIHHYTHKDFVLDPYGYFLIRIHRRTKEVEVGLCKERNRVAFIVKGKKPADIYYTITQQNLISRMEHAAYLGKELQKAFTAIELRIEYIQDSPLDFSKKMKN